MIKLIKTVLILSYESRLKQKEDLTNDLEREIPFLEEKINAKVKVIDHFNQKLLLLIEQEVVLITGNQQEYIMKVTLT